MALFAYMQRTQRILRDQRVQLINPTDLISYINEARHQIAGESQCVLAIGTLPISPVNQSYHPSAIAGFATGIGTVLNVRTVWLQIAGGQKWITPRPWPWFSLYNQVTPPLTAGPPTVWSQYSPGSVGLLYISPVPDQAYTLNVDCSCFPSSLTNDTDSDLVPALWTEAVAYYAAYLSLMSMQTGGNTQEADKMYKRYQEYVARARMAANSIILPSTYAQSQPMPENQLAAPGAR